MHIAAGKVDRANSADSQNRHGEEIFSVPVDLVALDDSRSGASGPRSASARERLVGPAIERFFRLGQLLHLAIELHVLVARLLHGRRRWRFVRRNLHVAIPPDHCRLMTPMCLSLMLAPWEGDTSWTSLTLFFCGSLSTRT